MLAVDDIQDALERPAGKRALNPALRVFLADVNQGEFVRLHGTNYLHCGRGGYALVYHIRTQDGREVALRCLTKTPSSDLADRCSALNTFLIPHAHCLPYFLDVRFYPNALFADGDYRPVFLMEWVDGETLHAYSQRRILAGDGPGIRKLADEIERMIIRMQAVDIAHGDLQHDNIMVTPTDAIRLVDYDSVYVPALIGRSCPVAGLAGYTHPSYLSSSIVRPFNVHMDTFAGLVLVISLRAISHDLSLFGRFTKDNLLFRADDLQDPLGSAAFALLLSQGDAQLAALASSLQAMCLDANKAQVPLAQVRGIVQERRKAPSARIAAPALPLRPSAWVPRSSLGASTFAMIFKQDASA